VFAIAADGLLGATLIQDATGGGDADQPNDDGAVEHEAPTPGGLWRGRISTVSGWTIGRVDDR
jgi:hypothetical protein